MIFVCLFVCFCFFVQSYTLHIAGALSNQKTNKTVPSKNKQNCVPRKKQNCFPKKQTKLFPKQQTVSQETKLCPTKKQANLCPTKKTNILLFFDLLPFFFIDFAACEEGKGVVKLSIFKQHTSVCGVT